MTVTISTAARDGNLEATAARTNGGTVRIRTGSGTTLAQATLANPAFNTAANGQITSRTIPEMTATAAGNAAEVQFLDPQGNVVITGDVTLAAGDGFLKFNAASLSFTVGQIIRIDSVTLTQPATA